MRHKLVITLFMLAMLTGQALAVQIVEVRTARPLENLLSIFSDKSTYEKGEIATITEYQDINANCNKLLVTVRVKDSNNVVINSVTKDLGAGGYMTAFIRMTQPTADLLPGTYAVSSLWYCDGIILGMDGYADSVTASAVSSFKVVNSNIITNPPQTCSKQCNTGYILINPSSPECYCQQAWVEGDGRCDLGEPSSSRDCIPDDEPGDTQPGNTFSLDQQGIIFIGVGAMGLGGIMLVLGLGVGGLGIGVAIGAVAGLILSAVI